MKKVEAVLNLLEVTPRGLLLRELSFSGSAAGIHLPNTGLLANTHAGQIPSLISLTASFLSKSEDPLTKGSQ